MKVTVLIATRNRSQGLRETLESLFRGSNTLCEGWEVVVVFDAASQDGTSEVCRLFRAKYPGRFRYIVQDNEGKSNALNVGIVAARGDILALTDDDVICDDDYISNIIGVFDRYPVDAAQGRILLDCEEGLPTWVSARHREFMSLRDFGENMQTSFLHHLTGTNMIVRTAAARAVGGFAPELGAGTRVGFSEDTEFSWRLRHGGYCIIYAPQIVVRHQLPRGRLTKSFFRKRYFRLGRSRAYFGPYEAPLWRYGLYVVKHLIMSEPKALQHRFKGRAAEALDCQCEARFQAGFFWQHCLFYLGVRRRLTRVTSWGERVQERSVEEQELQDVDPCRRTESARG